ncbi:cell adhesion molecule CEACAM1-like, partial [Aulostomus maculatus]
MESPAVFITILTIMSCATDRVWSQRIYASENPLPVGSNVTLYSHSSSPINNGVWIFNNNVILINFPGNTVIYDPWKERVTFNSSTSSLTIMSVQQDDSGMYTLQGENFSAASLKLSVQVPVSHVTLRANATNLVEFNDTAVLTCSVSNGSDLSYTWLNDSSVVTASDGVQLSDGGAILTIMAVTRYDVGPFMCNVSNGVSEEISPSVSFNISYGPSNTTMMIMPMEHTYRVGLNITLSCSVESHPPATVHWMVDGMHLNQSSPKLQLEEVTEGESGNYTCVFYNQA